MVENCDNCNVELNNQNESDQYPGICKDCIEKEPLIVIDENLSIT